LNIVDEFVNPRSIHLLPLRHRGDWERGVGAAVEEGKRNFDFAANPVNLVPVCGIQASNCGTFVGPLFS
jgi:hypothetical protein